MTPATKAKTNTVSTTLEKPENFAKLSTVRQAEVIHQMTQRSMLQSEIAERVGVSVPQVSNLLTIHEMPNPLKRLIESGKVSGTLVLQIRRDYKDASDDEVAKMIQEVLTEKGGAITRKDFIKATNKHNSLSLMKKILKKKNRNDVKKNEVSFEFVSGLLTGNLSEAQIKGFFGFR